MRVERTRESRICQWSFHLIGFIGIGYSKAVFRLLYEIASSSNPKINQKLGLFQPVIDVPIQATELQKSLNSLFLTFPRLC